MSTGLTDRKLLAGTPDGVYRVDGTVEYALPGVSVRQLRTRGSAVLAATGEGLFRTDGGNNWQRVETPVTNVYTVLPTEGRLFAGVLPAAVLVSADGNTFERLSGFERLANSAAWPTNPQQDRARVRSLAAPQEGVLLAGMEVGGLAVSRDGGETWRMVPAVPDDVHHVLPVTGDRWIVSCGTGGGGRRLRDPRRR